MGLRRLFKKLRRWCRGEVLGANHRMKLPNRKAAKALFQEGRVSFSIFVQIDSGVTSPCELRRIVESVRGQIYDQWQCFLVVASPLAEVVTSDSRIQILKASDLTQVWKNAAWAVSLRAGYELSRFALFWLAEAILRQPESSMIYADEDRKTSERECSEPWFKTDWDPLLFLSCPYFGGLTAYRTRVMDGIEFWFSDEFEFRAIEASAPQAIVHVPRILSHRLGTPAPLIRSDGEAVRRHFERGKWDATAANQAAGDWEKRIEFVVPDRAPLVSIIIPTRNAEELVRQCIESIFDKTTYANFEILLVDNGSDSAAALSYFEELAGHPQIEVIKDKGDFNYARLNNAAAILARGEVLVLLNNDTQVISPGWLRELVSLAIQPWAGAVGARLWYPNRTLQHAGVLVGMHGMAGHVHRERGRDDPGYFGRTKLLQSFTAVTGACLAVRSDRFHEIGGLEEVLAVGCNDIDFCLKLAEKGYRNVWTPFAELIHHESITRGLDDTPAKNHRAYQEVGYMRRRWPRRFFHDPAYNPNLSYESHQFEVSRYPRILEGLASWRGKTKTDLPRLLIVCDKWGSRKAERLIIRAESLQRQGLIESFAMADKKGFVRFSKGRREGFEMIVLSGRVSNSWAGREVMLSLPYLADWCEIPLADRLAGEHFVSEVLALSAGVVVTNAALKQQIDEIYDLHLGAYTEVVPDGVVYPESLAQSKEICGLVWIYDVAVPLGNSTTDIIAAIEQFSVKHRLPVFCFGDLPVSLRGRLSRGVRKTVDPVRFLQKHRNLIGLEPLEVSADGVLGDTIRAKSDIRMAEYGGLGIPAVYSEAAPYGQSDLKTGRVVENTTEAWLAALEELLAAGADAETENALKIRELRNIDRVSRDYWWPALQKVKLAQSFPVSWIGR